VLSRGWTTELATHDLHPEPVSHRLNIGYRISIVWGRLSSTTTQGLEM
jgi:hypothetical protein